MSPLRTWSAFGTKAFGVFTVFTVTLLGCGGAIDTSSEDSRRDPSPGETSPAPAPPPPPSRGPAPAPPPSTNLPPPSKIADPPGKGRTPFHLVVQNRSQYGIGADFFLDSTKVVSGGFPPHAKMTFDFTMNDGPHTLDVNASAIETLAAEKAVLFTLKGERWGIVDLSMARCDPCAPPTIDWKLQEKP